MRRLQRISGSTWGPPLLKMRHLFLAKIRPIISYDCAVWFLRGPDVRWSLSDALLRELESTQYRCLVRIAGAYRRISRECLLKELNIEPLELHLERHSSAFRARALDWDLSNAASKPERLSISQP